MSSKMMIKGRFNVEHYDKDGKLKATYKVPNGIVDVGLNKILNDMFDGSGNTAANPSTNWYIGLVDNAAFTAFANADTMGAHTGWVENLDYTGFAARPAWLMSTASGAGRSVTNLSATTDFPITATVTLKGIFIVDDPNTTPGTAGTLWSTASFASNVTANNGDLLKITYTVSG